MLKNKLFILTIFILSLTLISSGLIYYKNINEIFEEQSKLNIHHDIKMFKAFLENKQKSIKNEDRILGYHIVYLVGFGGVKSPLRYVLQEKIDEFVLG